MSPSDPPAQIGLSWRMREHEARLLADALRDSRSTVLYAVPGASRSALLAQGVVPLLSRREADGGAGHLRDARVVTPFIDRREAVARGGKGGAPNEHVVHFADWDAEPLAALQRAIRASVPGGFADAAPGDRLADALEVVCERLDARLLVVLDAFEEFCEADPAAAATDRFVHAVGEAIGRPQLRVNFLFVVDDRLEGRLDALRDAIPGFDDSTVRLLGFERAGGTADKPAGPRAALAPHRRAPASSPSASSTSAARSEPPTLIDALPAPDASPMLPVPAPAAPRPRRARPPKTPRVAPVPIKADGVYAFIEATLKQTAAAPEPWHGADALPPAPARRPDDAGPRPSPPGTSAPDASAHRPPARPRTPATGGRWLDAAIAWWRRRTGRR